MVREDPIVLAWCEATRRRTRRPLPQGFGCWRLELADAAGPTIDDICALTRCVWAHGRGLTWRPDPWPVDAWRELTKDAAAARTRRARQRADRDSKGDAIPVGVRQGAAPAAEVRAASAAALEAYARFLRRYGAADKGGR